MIYNIRNSFNKLLQNFVDSHEENQGLVRHREIFLIRSCFQKWYEVIPEFKAETENECNEIIGKFRFVRYFKLFIFTLGT